ncbi:MAG: type II toxin-antitoxin system VapB family antitoxin [Propionibacteriaceae bacterium]|jgi:Arc/MetJ family transcription regulator|nr:type II toxin-antitoxin system VapB family antitoxin [Propionibacteriaceae bacterium]
MTITSVDLDSDLLTQAKELTGQRTTRAVVDLALRRLVAAGHKQHLLAGIAALDFVPAGLGAPTRDYPDEAS